MANLSSARVDVPVRGILARIFRVGFPQVVIVAVVFMYVASSIGEGHDKDRQWFVLFRQLLLIAGGTFLGLWALFFAGWSKTYVSVALLVLIGGGWFTLEAEHSGDLGSTLKVRRWVLHLFNASHEDKIAEQRRERSDRTIDLTPQPEDSPGYRGWDRTGVVDGPALLPDFNERKPLVVWKQLTYGGFSSFAIVNSFLFTMEQRLDDEAVVCYDALNGKECWAHTWPAKFKGTGGEGPRATPTVDGGEVFAIGATGLLVCLDGATGTRKWAVDTLQGNKNLSWAMSGSPLVYGDVVVVNPGTQSQSSAGKALMAYDRKTGEVVWRSGNAQAGYSSPMLVSLLEHTQILLFDGQGLAGYDPDDGAELWRHRWTTDQGINVAQPIVVENVTATPISFGGVAGGLGMQPIITRPGEVFIASGYGRGGALLRVESNGEAWSVQEVWTTSQASMRCKFASPVLFDGHIYGLDDGDLQCISAADGSKKWTDKRIPGEGAGIGHGQLLLAGDRLVILSEFGEIVLVRATPERFDELGRMKVLEGKKTWNNPAMSDGRLYIRNHLEMACVSLRE